MFSFEKVRRSIFGISETLVFYSTPKSLWIAVSASAIGFWTGRIVYTFAPSIIANVMVRRTIYKVGNVYVGHVIGVLFVAPAAVPTFTPYLVAGSAFLSSYAFIIITNLVMTKIYPGTRTG